MAKTINYTPALAKEYRRLFETSHISPKWAKRVKKAAEIVYAGREMYQQLAARFNAPWPLFGVIHMMEGECNFHTHLHNGDSLAARTHNDPAGRPLHGKPPFPWLDSAIDAIEMKGWGSIKKWTLERAMYELERYNGFGHRLYHPDVLSPYLWSGTDKYSRGKYVRDHVFDANAVSGQVGVMAILQALADIDAELALDKILPGEDFATEDPVEDETTIMFVQQRLTDLGYHEVGKVDGLFGKATEGAILAFRHNNDLPLKATIDDELLTALARAASKPISDVRVTATTTDLRAAEKPALAPSLSSKVISGITAAGAGAYGVVQGVVSNLDGAKSFLGPVKDLLGSVPTGVWVAMVGAAAVAIYLNSRKAETEVTSAYREGSLR